MNETQRRILCAVSILAGLLVLPAFAGEGMPLMRPGEDGVSYPKVRFQVSPDYPAAALEVEAEGTVTVAALVLSDGSVGAVEVIDSDLPRLGFEESAARAVMRWRYKPAKQRGTRVDSYALVQMHFRKPIGYEGQQQPLGSGGVHTVGLPIYEKQPVGGTVATRSGPARMPQSYVREHLAARMTEGEIYDSRLTSLQQTRLVALPRVVNAPVAQGRK
ncbi:MAG: energy transducer TonB [bacterium]|nr:energy transducer TonB [bacterium]